jgi:hypothetical protein
MGFGSHGVMDPFRERWGGLNAYRFYFGQTVAYIKVDKRPFARPFDELALCAGPILRVVTRDFLNSKDFHALKQTALRSKENELASRLARRR